MASSIRNARNVLAVSFFIRFKLFASRQPEGRLRSWKKANSIAPVVVSPYRFRRPDQDKNMADAANKYPENVGGKYYVDDQCIDCDLCRETAPANFKRNDDGGHSYVYKQPESPEEEALCKEAMEGCPMASTGSDG